MYFGTSNCERLVQCSSRMAWLFVTSFVTPRNDQLSAGKEGEPTDLGDRLLRESEGQIYIMIYYILLYQNTSFVRV